MKKTQNTNQRLHNLAFSRKYKNDFPSTSSLDLIQSS